MYIFFHWTWHVKVDHHGNTRKVNPPSQHPSTYYNRVFSREKSLQDLGPLNLGLISMYRYCWNTTHLGTNMCVVFKYYLFWNKREIKTAENFFLLLSILSSIICVTLAYNTLACDWVQLLRGNKSLTLNSLFVLCCVCVWLLPASKLGRFVHI